MSPADPARAYGRLRQEAANRHARRGAKPVIMVGAATCGRAAGALEVLQAFREAIVRRGLDCSVLEAGCLGHCYAEPLVVIHKPGRAPVVYGRVNAVIAERLVDEYLLGDNPCLENVLFALGPDEALPAYTDFPRARFEKRVLFQNCGLIDPADIYDYIAAGGYGALVNALARPPRAVIGEITVANLRGRGGAGYSAGLKLQACHDAPGPVKYVICNADEGDPGSFVDRALLESDPQSVLEGLIIAAYAAGASRGYVYVRAEYPLAVARLQTALKQARQLNLLGANILGTDLSLDITLFPGAGAFVCGEETALIASIEGRAGLPHYRPPYPSARGLFGRPTLVNNVKTLAYVRHILQRGAAWFKATGTPESPGTALFSLAGKVVNTGMAEVPLGTTLRQLIYDVGSGIPGGKPFKAVQIGGPSGGCLDAAALDLPIDFDSLQQAGGIMGSGGVIVMDGDDCPVEMARYFLEFTRRESCGKCTFCRLGTRQMLTILTDFTQGKGTPADLETLEKLALEVKAGSLCALGQTAPNPVLSAVRYFRQEFEAHITMGRCPALMCRELITYYIRPDKCERSCDACVGACTVEAIAPAKNRVKIIDPAKCVKCGTCLAACPTQYNAIVKLSPPDEKFNFEDAKYKDEQRHE